MAAFPHFWAMVLTLASAPSTSVANERCFASANKTISIEKARMSDRTFERLVCLRVNAEKYDFVRKKPKKK